MSDGTTRTPKHNRRPPSREGRPPAWSDQRQRDIRLKAWAMVEEQGLTPAQAGKLQNPPVASRTIYDWIAAARTYDDPMAIALLRREAERTRGY